MSSLKLYRRFVDQAIANDQFWQFPLKNSTTTTSLTFFHKLPFDNEVKMTDCYIGGMLYLGGLHWSKVLGQLNLTKAEMEVEFNKAKHDQELGSQILDTCAFVSNLSITGLPSYTIYFPLLFNGTFYPNVSFDNMVIIWHLNGIKHFRKCDH